LSHFESAIRPLADVKIVISSTWRFHEPIWNLRERFSQDIADRIEGITPQGAINSIYMRYDEICAYLEKQGLDNANWIAVDDDPVHFPKDSPLLLTDPYKGFDNDCEVRLRQMILEHSCII
jgi:hypothetical protein